MQRIWPEINPLAETTCHTVFRAENVTTIELGVGEVKRTEKLKLKEGNDGLEVEQHKHSVEAQTLREAPIQNE